MPTDTKQTRRLGRGLSSLIGSPSAVPVRPGPAAEPAAAKTPGSGQQGGSTPRRPGEAKAPAGSAAAESAADGGVRHVALSRVSPSPYQPRREFGEEALRLLADSIRVSGVMQPIVVRERGGAFELIAGERRWRAAALAGLETIPAIVAAIDDRTAAEWALVENLQREDLGPIETAHGLRRLFEQFGLQQGEIAERLGLARASVANLIRLTELEPELQELVARGSLTAGHAKALLAMPAGAARAAFGKRCAEAGWSVRRLEAALRRVVEAAMGGGAMGGAGGSGARPAPEPVSRAALAARDVERRLSDHLGTRARLRTDKTGKRGSVVIEFYDLDHLEGVLGRMGVGE